MSRRNANGDRPGRFARWRAEVPYPRDSDEAVPRREGLRLSIIASGALFAGTALLALLGRTDDRVRGGRKEIVRATDVAPGGDGAAVRRGGPRPGTAPRTEPARRLWRWAEGRIPPAVGSPAATAAVR